MVSLQQGRGAHRVLGKLQSCLGEEFLGPWTHKVFWGLSCVLGNV